MDEEEKEVEEKQPESTTNGKSNRQKVVYLAGAIILVILIALGIWKFSKTSQKENPSPTPTTEASPSSGASVSPSPTPSGSTTVSPKPSPKASPTPTPTPTPSSQTLTLGATASLDGWRASNNGSNWNYPYIQAGHNSTLTERGFESFDISSIPSGATIDQATLRLYQTETVGTPYTSSLIVDHVNYGSTWSATPYDGSPIASNIGTLANNTTLEWKDLVVTSSIKDDITNGRTRAQFGIRFATEIMGADAWARFTSADGSGNTPQLVINYH